MFCIIYPHIYLLLFKEKKKKIDVFLSLSFFFIARGRCVHDMRKLMIGEKYYFRNIMKGG